MTTSPLAKAIAERIRNDGMSQWGAETIAHAFDCGDFDDLLQPPPANRPTLSDETRRHLLEEARSLEHDAELVDGWSPFTFEERDTFARIAAELRAWEEGRK